MSFIFLIWLLKLVELLSYNSKYLCIREEIKSVVLIMILETYEQKVMFQYKYVGFWHYMIFWRDRAIREEISSSLKPSNFFHLLRNVLKFWNAVNKPKTEILNYLYASNIVTFKTKFSHNSFYLKDLGKSGKESFEGFLLSAHECLIICNFKVFLFLFLESRCSWNLFFIRNK